MLDASTLSNGGKQELMHYIHYISSCSPPLDGVDTSDMIDTGREEEFIWLPFKNKLANKKAAGMVKTGTFLKDMHFWRSPTNIIALLVLSGLYVLRFVLFFF